jgi:hypothetical protein
MHENILYVAARANGLDYKTTHCSLKAYCAILVRHSTFRHYCHHARAPSNGRWNCVSKKCPVILPKCRFTRCILGSFTCRKATIWDRRFYFPSERRRAVDFFALKIRQLRPGVNPRTWVPKASQHATSRPPKPLYKWSWWRWTHVRYVQKTRRIELKY